MTAPRTIVQKIWDDHVVTQDPGAPAVLAVDLHLVHEVTSPQAFEGLRLAGRPVRRPDRTLATADHNVPTDGTPVAARIRDEIKRLEAVELAVADDPLARQSAIDAEVEVSVPRSKAGKGGTRAYRGKSQKRMR